MPRTKDRAAKADPSAAFAELISTARHRAGMSQFELAARAGVARTTIARWEGGYAQKLDRDVFKNVCRTLDIRQGEALRVLGFLDEPAPLETAA